MIIAKRKGAIRESNARRAFWVCNVIFLALVCVIVIIPIWNVIITSFSEDISPEQNRKEQEVTRDFSQGKN